MSDLRKVRSVMLCLAVLGLQLSQSRAGDREPIKRELQLIYIFEGARPEFLFVIGQSGFKSVESLKEHLKTWPPGSELRWAPGCVRVGGEPLLSSEKDMQAFRAFLKERKIRFVLVPSG